MTRAIPSNGESASLNRLWIFDRTRFLYSSRDFKNNERLSPKAPYKLCFWTSAAFIKSANVDALYPRSQNTRMVWLSAFSASNSRGLAITDTLAILDRTVNNKRVGIKIPLLGSPSGTASCSDPSTSPFPVSRPSPAVSHFLDRTFSSRHESHCCALVVIEEAIESRTSPNPAVNVGRWVGQ